MRLVFSAGSQPVSVMGLNGPSSGVTPSLPEQILLQVCRIRAPCDSASEITGHSGQINPPIIVGPSAARRCFLAVRQRPVGSRRSSRRRRDLLSFTTRQRGDFCVRIRRTLPLPGEEKPLKVKSGARGLQSMRCAFWCGGRRRV